MLLASVRGARAASAGDEPWRSSDRVATEVEINDDTIVLRTESKDGGDVRTIEISAGRSSPRADARCSRRDRDARSDGGRVELDLGDIERFGCLQVNSLGDAVVRVGGDMHVSRDERIDGDLVVIGGSIDVEGQVDGDVVALGGSVVIRSRGKVEGDVVALGGDVRLHRKAEIEGDAVAVGGEVKDKGARIGGETVRVGVDIRL